MKPHSWKRFSESTFICRRCNQFSIQIYSYPSEDIPIPEPESPDINGFVDCNESIVASLLRQ